MSDPQNTTEEEFNEWFDLNQQLATALLERDTARAELHIVEEDLRKESELLAEAQARIKDLEDEREKLAQQFVIAGMLRDNLSDQLTTAQARIKELEKDQERLDNCFSSRGAEIWSYNYLSGTYHITNRKDLDNAMEGRNERDTEAPTSMK